MVFQIRARRDGRKRYLPRSNRGHGSWFERTVTKAKECSKKQEKDTLRAKKKGKVRGA